MSFNIKIRIAQKNNCNTGIRKDNTSGYKGVCWHKKSQKWAAYITSKGKKTNLGLFETPELAHRAYSEASKIYHGEFGRVK